MKVKFLLLFLFIQMSLFAQYIDGPANVRMEPQGLTIISLDNYLIVRNVELIDNWYKIRLTAFVNIDSSKNDILQKGVILRNFKGERIGEVLNEFKYNFDWEENLNNMRKVSISGYTFKNNIVDNIPSKYKPENKFSLFKDSTISSVKIFNTDDGSTYTVKQLVYYYTRSCFYDEVLLIKETNTITQLAGAEGNHTDLVCEFIYNNYLNDPKNFKLKHECDEIEFEREYYRTRKYGCCGAETYFELFNYKNPTPLLKCKSHLLKITGSSDNRTYFFGYLPVNRPNKKDLILGILYFASDEKTINEITFIAKNREVYENILPWTPKMNFSPKQYEIVYKPNVHKEEYEISLNTYKSNLIPNVNNLQSDNFTIDIEVMDDSKVEKTIVKIPVINGKLYGKAGKSEVIVDTE